ncbi:hypothetical protein DVS28_b0128 (plasmid) [Euzebya pacifica]|uniref:Uncharacterized protein n=1 Tax=Euzebya pacifica TaxID=1608957 RepID=A0A346Y601_9ACTN|nr:hypothetical protein [Euzebya pacifica]AXV09898.1 hypothetical protein DVS28_b0128 [Euzebya pacifica]
MANDLSWARLARLAANPPYLAADLTHRDLDAVMVWLTDVTVAARRVPARIHTTAASTLWLRCAVLTDRLGHADDDEIERRVNEVVSRYEHIRAELAARLAERIPVAATSRQHQIAA